MMAAVLRRLVRSRVGQVGVALTGSLVALGLFGGLIAPADPFLPTGLPLRPPGGAHLFGTDDLGRDVLSGVLHGARISLLVGLVTSATAAVLGTAVGATAGFYGRTVDDLLMRLTEFVQVIPRFFLAVLVAALFGPSIVFLVLLFGLTFWPGTTRIRRHTAGSSPDTFGRWLVTRMGVCDGVNFTKSCRIRRALMVSPPVSRFMGASARRRSLSDSDTTTQRTPRRSISPVGWAPSRCMNSSGSATVA